MKVPNFGFFERAIDLSVGVAMKPIPPLKSPVFFELYNVRLEIKTRLGKAGRGSVEEERGRKKRKASLS